MRASAATVPPRHLLIMVSSLAIEDGQTPPPARGEVGCYPLLFREVDSGEPGTGVTSFQARAEPLYDGSPLGTVHHRGGGSREETTWPTVLHGDGWSASWSAPRPVIGQVRLSGVLLNDLAVGVHAGVRGRVTRVQVVTETIDPDQRTWRPIPGGQRLRDVELAPRWFDHGPYAPLDVPTAGPHPAARVPGVPYATETGVLVDLDLDHVPPLPPRPAIVPGSLDASGPDLWIADTHLPLIVRVRGPRTDTPEVSAVTWRGRITRGRVPHADPDGCWITGPDGVHRMDLEGNVRRIDDAPASFAVAGDGLLLVRTQLEPSSATAPRLIDHRGTVIEVELGDRHVTAAVALGDGSGFMLLLRQHDDHSDPDPTDRRPWLGRLSQAGALVEGPYLEVGHPAMLGLLGIDPPMLLDEQRAQLHRIRDDLSLSDGAPQRRHVLRAYARAGRLWVAAHPPHSQDIALGGAEACWPLPGPPEYPEDRQYWLLTELDPDTLDPMVSTLVHHIPDHLAVDDTGTVWIPADGVRHLPAEDGAAAEPLDVPDLLTRVR